MWQLWDWDLGGWSASVTLSHNRPRRPAVQTAGDADGLPPRARGPVDAEEEEGVITYHVMGAGVGAVRC